MKLKMIAASIAMLVTASAWADSPNEWGYWDTAKQGNQTNGPSIQSTTGPALAFKVADKSDKTSERSDQDRPTDGARSGDSRPVFTAGGLPTTIVQNFTLPTTTTTAPNDANLPTPDKWFGYGALEGGTPSGAYDDNAFLLVGADWVYGTIPATGSKTMTFRIAGEDMISKTSGTPTNYYSWSYNRDPSSTATSYVHVNQRIPFPTDVPMTIGHWHKGAQTYYALVGSATQLSDLQSLAAGPTLAYTGQSMGGSVVSVSVNFASSTWTGTWTAGGTLTAMMSGSARNTPAFNAAGTVTGAKIQSTSITGVTGLDAAASFVKGTFYGNGGAVLGGLTVIKTSSAQTSDLFVACKPGVTGCGGAI